MDRDMGGKEMIGEPAKRISKKALTVWRITRSLFFLCILLIAIGTSSLVIIFDWPLWIIGIAVFVVILYVPIEIYLIPLIKWKRWRYEVREHEIELQHGVFIVTRTLVPMVRVQHVDTEQGPVLRKYNLATVKVSTAATVHEIPALEVEEAEELRRYISQLARVADEDV